MNTSESGRVGVFVVAGVRLLRESLADIFRIEPGYEILGTAPGDDADADAIRDCDADVLLIDSGIPDSPGFVRRLRPRDNSMRVVALAVPEHADTIIALAEAGTFAFVAREGSRDDVLATVAAAVHGEVMCPPSVTVTLLRRVQALAGRDVVPPSGALTLRERQILRLIGSGASNKQISAELRIELSTVKNHVHNILEKLGVPDRIAATDLVRGREALDHLRPRTLVADAR